MKKTLFLLGTAFTFGMLSCDQNEMAQPANDTKPSSSKVAAGAWVDGFYDGFNGTSSDLNRNYWNVVGQDYTDPNGQAPRTDYNSTYTHYVDNRANVAVNTSLHALEIGTTRNCTNSYNFGFISSKGIFNPTLNTEISIKARIKFFTASHTLQDVNGFWPSFWTTNADGTTLMERELTLRGYEVEVGIKGKTAYRYEVKYPRMLYPQGMSTIRDEKLLIQFDTQAQQFDCPKERFILNRFGVLTEMAVTPMDVIFAQKCHAILGRPRNKGEISLMYAIF